MHRILTINIICFLLSNSLLTHTSTRQSLAIPAKEFRIPGMSGTLPIHLGRVMRSFNWAKNNSCIESKGDTNLIILHGPSGNGKTTIAHKFAELTDSYLIKFNSQFLVNDGSSKTIQDLFDQVTKNLERSLRKGCILCIDNIDALTKNENALTSLRCYLSEFKKEGRFLFIGTTSNIEKLPYRFSNIFTSHVIFVPNPDEIQRAELIQGYFKFYDMPELDEDELLLPLNDIAKINVNVYKQVCTYTSNIDGYLKSINMHLQKMKTETDIQIPLIIQHLIEKAQNACISLSALSKAEILNQENISEPINEYCKLTNRHCKTVSAYLLKLKKDQPLDADRLALLVKETQNMSAGAIEQLVIKIKKISKTANKADIPTIIATQIGIAKARVLNTKREEDNRKRKEYVDEKIKELTLVELILRIKSEGNTDPETDALIEKGIAALGYNPLINFPRI